MTLFNHLIPSFTRASDPAAANGAAEASPAQRPAYNVRETDSEYRVTVQLPGVAKDGLEVTAENDQIRITGKRAWTQPTGWTAVHRETADAGYELVLTHENEVDADKIVAELRDGILSVTLPKHEALKPRKIAIA